jgi:hypothetical protein
LIAQFPVRRGKPNTGSSIDRAFVLIFMSTQPRDDALPLFLD